LANQEAVSTTLRRRYERALQDSGVTQEDLTLLRELADLKSNELEAEHGDTHVSRVLLERRR